MNNKTMKITLIGLFATLSYISFTFFQIKIILPIGTTSFHLGNTFAVLGALIIGGKYGGIAAAIGMGIGDLMDPIYILYAPKTIILKFCISYITGLFAFKVYKINKKEPNLLELIIICFSGLLFNVLCEPLISYIYSVLFFGTTTDIALTFASMNFIVTFINASFSCISSVLLYKLINKRINKIVI